MRVTPRISVRIGQFLINVPVIPSKGSKPVVVWRPTGKKMKKKR